jgi:hypothetical protein
VGLCGSNPGPVNGASFANSPPCSTPSKIVILCPKIEFLTIRCVSYIGIPYTFAT